MSINVKNLTKIYGSQKAVNDISFEVETGQVLGFLGPNGAGKSTTMKILTCFIPQTSGKAFVSGFNIEEEPMEVKKKIGYLPESNPLYYDLYVIEYLNFVAGLHGIKKNKSNLITNIIGQTGLHKEKFKKIGQLSKGYKQRVGLAQAMIHNPSVLILDEPTSGLDPNQLSEIRELIVNLGKEKTVILSTHIMQEVQAMCDRVIIINNGKIAVDDTTDNLQQHNKQSVIVFVEFKEKVNTEDLKKLSNVLKIERINDKSFKLHSAHESDIREDIFKFAVSLNLTILNLHTEKSTLEDVFRDITLKQS
ncbi:MAG: gliding motility-associated ABC transporter ATP-binding subunit GldA [Chitinophagaceae bacterium]|nr:MAG: gliding motility-associated ABC transporter ATP-binding subunit GldA [Chitinophagaceae bacterium]